MTYRLKKACTEVYIVLKNMPQEYIDKIPVKTIELLECHKIDNYAINLDKQNPIDRKKLSKEAMIILAIFNCRYWCPNSKVRKKLYDQYLSNGKEQKKETTRVESAQTKEMADVTGGVTAKRETAIIIEETLEKESIVMKSVQTDRDDKNKALVVNQKENILKILINKIKKLFTR